MGLRVEEDLGVAHALGGGLSEVGPGQVVEVTLVEQYLGALVVEVQERLQVGEVVGLANLPHRAVPRWKRLSRTLSPVPTSLRCECAAPPWVSPSGASR